MASQAYVSELQGGQSQSQPAPTQYVTDTSLPAPPQPPAVQKQAPPPPTQAQTQAAPPQQTLQYVSEVQSASPQSSSTQPSPQYIVVTVTESTLRPSETVSDSSSPPTVVQTAVPTQVVQQVQASQQRLLVQGGISVKGQAVPSPLQQVSLPPQQQQQQQRLIVQTSSPTGKGGQVSTLSIHGVQQQQQQVHSPPERSVVQSTAPTPKPAQVQQLTVPGLQQAHVSQEVQQLQQVPVQHVYSNQVQYVEAGDASYTTSTIRSSSYPYSETPLYSQSADPPYYESGGSGSQVSTPVTSQAVPSASGAVPMYVSGGQIVANPSTAGAGPAAGQGGNTATAVAAGSYVIQGGYMLGSASQSYSHTTRASPATVQWLLDNYETAEGVSLPRSTLYCHYLLHCQEQKLEPVNAASFGKLIRSVFMGLRTRRLGTRGNSKYHYYGLRIKANSPLLRLIEDQQHLAMRQQPFSQKQRLKPVQKVEGMANGMSLGGQQQQGSGLSDISAQVQQYQQFLDASRTLPEFAEIDLQGKALPDGIAMEHIKAFHLLYREHCEAILDVMINLQFTLVETLWKTFWRFSESQPSDSTPLLVHDESEKRLPKGCLVVLCKYDPVLRWTKECDNMLYQGLVEILIPDVLRPIPSALTQAIRNFAKSLESWLTNAMMNIPEEMVRVKVMAASAFAQTLRRYTSLNHLAQAARAVLQNTAQINQMLSDLNRVDFANVQEQASWVCRCNDVVVQRLEQDFKLTLQQQNSLEQWAAWLDSVVTQVLKPYQGSTAFPKAAKLFLLKWSFYSSMVIRDLTLRSAASFGSFHLIRLLYDEYMYYLIEHRVAQAKGETPIAVMGEFANLGRSLNALDPDKEEEEEEEEESDEESQQEISLHSSEVPGLSVEQLGEPPSKLARTDTRAIYTQAAQIN
ncbi:MHC class II regulatory factor RFX1-like isoform X5 [Acipenser ruthenus]|nr:MHC class II regulatory factor RFX1-like isoform X5 [Acipenser ruthenus]XP_058863260.1 MHC class II regulatory factor RFX1-like isoform X5 [Acipenser ruthenus]XP_058863261.1 MHC class II regulatory factor RFX1-like isoform X5 [Acipenser ruthenus]